MFGGTSVYKEALAQITPESQNSCLMLKTTCSVHDTVSILQFLIYQMSGRNSFFEFERLCCCFLEEKKTFPLCILQNPYHFFFFKPVTNKQQNKL